MFEGQESARIKMPNTHCQGMSKGIIHKDGLCKCWPQVVFSQKVETNPCDIAQSSAPLPAPVQNPSLSAVQHAALLSASMTTYFRNMECFRDDSALSGRGQYVSGYTKVVGQKPGFYAERAPSELKDGLNDLKPCNDTWNQLVSWGPKINIPPFRTDFAPKPGHSTENVWGTIFDVPNLNTGRQNHVPVPPDYQQEIRSRSMDNTATQKAANNGLMEMPTKHPISTTTQNPAVERRQLYSEVCRKGKEEIKRPKQQKIEASTLGGDTKDVQEVYDLTYFPPKRDAQVCGLNYCPPKRDVSVNELTYCPPKREAEMNGLIYCPPKREAEMNGRTYCPPKRDMEGHGLTYCPPKRDLEGFGLTYCPPKRDVEGHGLTYCPPKREAEMKGLTYCPPKRDLEGYGLTYCPPKRELEGFGLTYCPPKRDMEGHGLTYCPPKGDLEGFGLTYCPPKRCGRAWTHLLPSEERSGNEWTHLLSSEERPGRLWAHLLPSEERPGRFWTHLLSSEERYGRTWTHLLSSEGRPGRFWTYLLSSEERCGRAWTHLPTEERRFSE
ncbi:hypothetical protein CDAR_79761 [Caerostris darwini]|uniref:Uncharacterized protein n=1 Tax=Caerostris darwini TaxID=1538125 RepID=A0AAV4W9J5_9ARAC|nr:hypothetical protein CDAR_79761 [Caerostris darwini]